MKKWLGLACLCLGGCGVLTEQGIYEGVRQQQQMRREPTQPDTQRLPDFDKFKDERNKMKPQAD